MALTEIYVDPSIAGNSGTGTIGDPYGDLQYGLNTATRDATNGNRFNIKAGTAEVMAAAMTLATYGTPTAAAPLVFQGYTSAAGDGGIGEINNGGANVAVYSGAAAHVHWVDMKLGNVGTAQILLLGTNCLLVNCEFISSSNFAGVQFGNFSQAIRCKFNSNLTGTYAVRFDVAGIALHCNFIKTAGACINSNTGARVEHCVFSLSGSATGINTTLTGGYFANNSFYGGATTGTGLVVSGNTSLAALNNIFSDFSGAGAEAILISGASSFLVLGANAYYNNTNNVSGTIVAVYQPSNIALTNAPFTNAAGGDFSIAAAAKAELASQGWPSSFLGISTNQYLDPGAAQIEPVAGGLLVHPGMSGGMRG